MNQLKTLTNNTELAGKQQTKFTSLYLVDQINSFREVEGNRKVLLHKSLLTKIEAEFSEEITGKNIFPSEYKDSSGKKNKMYELDFEQSLQILMSESKSVRKGVIAVLKEQQKKIESLQLQLPDFTNPILAARAWADEVEAKLIAQQAVQQLESDVTELYEVATELKETNDKVSTLFLELEKEKQELEEKVETLEGIPTNMSIRDEFDMLFDKVAAKKRVSNQILYNRLYAFLKRSFDFDADGVKASIGWPDSKIKMIEAKYPHYMPEFITYLKKSL